MIEFIAAFFGGFLGSAVGILIAVHKAEKEFNKLKKEVLKNTIFEYTEICEDEI